MACYERLLEIRAAGLIELAPCFDALPSLGRYWMGETPARRGTVLAAFSRETQAPLGLCVLIPIEGEAEAVYLFTMPGFRRQGVARALLSYARHWAQARGLGLSLRVVQEQESTSALTALAAACGLCPAGQVILSSCVPTDLRTRAAWFDLCARRGDRLLARLEGRGCRTDPFLSAPPAVLNRLREQIGTRFPGWLDPFRLPRRDDAYSFVTYRAGEPLAFCAATSIGTKLVFEQLSVQERMRGSGLFFPPLYRFIDMTIEKKVSRVSFAISRDNAGMQRLAAGLLPSLIDRVRRQTNYHTVCRTSRAGG